VTDFNTSKILNNKIIFILSNQSYKVLGKIAKSGIKLGSTTHTGKICFMKLKNIKMYKTVDQFPVCHLTLP